MGEGEAGVRGEGREEVRWGGGSNAHFNNQI